MEKRPRELVAGDVLDDGFRVTRDVINNHKHICTVWGAEPDGSQGFRNFYITRKVTVR